MTSPDSFYKLVAMMRFAQKDYFTKKVRASAKEERTAAMNKKFALEKRVDDELKQLNINTNENPQHNGRFKS